MRVFGGDPALIGKSVELNQTPYRVIGVMNPEFRWPRNVDLWAPIDLPPTQYAEDNRFNENFGGVAQLRPGINIATASAGIDVMSDRVRNNGTRGGKYAQDFQWGIFAVPFTGFAVGDTKTPTLVLAAAVGLVLLIVCKHRGTHSGANHRESARDRRAHGIGCNAMADCPRDGRRECDTGRAGALLGIGAAKAGVSRPLVAGSGADGRGSGGHSLLVSIVSAALFSAAPAWQATRVNRSDALKDGGRAQARRSNTCAVVLVI